MIRNLLNETVRLLDDDREVATTFEPDEQSLRLERTAGDVDGHPLADDHLDALPEREEGTWFIVPGGLVAARDDLVTPLVDGTEERRDGRVHAVTALTRVRLG